MKTINIVKLVGNPCLLAPEKGSVLASSILEALKQAKVVVVDFTGYEFLSSAFLNHAFGQLCIQENWDQKTFHRLVNIRGLDEDDRDELALALDNAETRRQLLKNGVNTNEYYSSRLPA